MSKEQERIEELEQALNRLLVLYVMQLELTDQNKVDDYPEIVEVKRVLKNKLK